MLAGELSMTAARSIVTETDVLTPEQRRLIDAAVAAEAQLHTPGKVAAMVRVRVHTLDPEAAERRARQARADKRVSCREREDGMAGLSAHLPAEQAAACWDALDSHARGLRADGDPRSISHLMCDTLVERPPARPAPTRCGRR